MLREPRLDTFIDIETADTKPGATILSIGAVIGELGTGQVVDEFYENVEWRTATTGIDIDTMLWWSRQSEEARHAAFMVPGAPIAEVLQRLNDRCAPYKCKGYWGNGASFDISLLEAKYDSCGILPPWHFWDIRDVRTLLDVWGGDKSSFQFKGTKHHALDDARHEFRSVAVAWRQIQAAWSESRDR